MMPRLCLGLWLLLVLACPTLGAERAGRAVAPSDGRPDTPTEETRAAGATIHPIGPAGAPPLPEYRPAPPATERSLLWDTVRMGLSLGLVLLLLGAGVRLLRRWPGVGSREGAARRLQVLERIALTPKDSLCLVRIGREVLVVGAGAAGLTLLARLEAGQVETGPPSATLLTAPRYAPRPPDAGLRLRELAARVREVQAAWGLGGRATENRR